MRWQRINKDHLSNGVGVKNLKIYRFNEYEKAKIMNRFGSEFYKRVLRDIEVYADLWALSSFQLIPSFSANLVFRCISAKYGNAVLKLGNPSSREIASEFHTLREYEGRRFCSVFEVDLEHGIMLEECVQPGTPLRDENSLNKRLSVFSSLYNGLHIPPANAKLYPTYNGWVERITEYMSKREDCKELYLYMKKAHDICASVSAIYPQQMLLHGDFHHDNILLGRDGEYRIIDPKGVVGDPVFDVPRFILNEFDDEITDETYKKINKVISVLERNLKIPDDMIRKCLFVETAMGNCWCVEDGSTPEEYAKLVRNVAFAESFVNG
jgi:streptomycin 6-kinase